ncbi:MAG TPA: serine/threonine-protein kinase [Polyangiaceae bacterium]|nr:serine/threonine-protein kinase [Polyangiaceae bacterium]
MTEDDAEPESEYDGFLRAVARAPARALGPVESSLADGAVVAGKLRVVRALGAGGMGKVYEVEHELTRRRGALKVLHPGAAASVTERFLREATAAARIGNPHVAETFDAGRLESGEPYLLMELLEGETLERRLLRAGRIPPAELAELIQQACEGVQAAHEAGIVHRDLKPDNLFVTSRDGRPFVKVIDFGISRFDEGRTGTPGLTKDGATMGTPYYMAPEQVRGAATDARTDVYALGVILYECACGRRPFEAPYVEQLAVLIHQGRPVPLEHGSSLPRSFCDVVRTAMAVEPLRRFESARALADALAPFRVRTIVAQAGSPTPATPSVEVARVAHPRPHGPRRWLLLGWMALAGLVLGSGVAALAARWAREPASARVSSDAGPASAPPVPAGSVAIAIAQPAALVPDTAWGPRALPDGAAPAAPAAPGRPAARASGAPFAPPSRAQETGLAGENPFR